MGQVGVDWSQFENEEEMIDALIQDMENKEVDEESWPSTQSFWIELLQAVKAEIKDEEADNQ